MGQWVVTVAGIAILSVLCDVILPEGQTRKYIKTVIGVIVTVVMIQPIVKLSANLFSADTSVESHYEISVQQSYLDMVDVKKNDSQLSAIETTLNAQGIPITDIEMKQMEKKIYVIVNSEKNKQIEERIASAISAYYKDYKIEINWQDDKTN